MIRKSKNTTCKKSGKEFRKLNNKVGKGHPTYIYAKVGKKYKFIGITHSEITDGVKNIKMDQNPDPKDKRSSYFRPKSSEANRSAFGSRLKGWRLSDNDKIKADDIIRKNKNPR